MMKRLLLGSLLLGCFAGPACSGSDDGSSATVRIPDAEPRDVGTPLPAELLGEEREKQEGKPKLGDTFYDGPQEIGVWIPPGVDKIRGVHLNLLVNPNYGGGLVSHTFDRQMASSWQFAQVAGWNVWQKDRSSSEEGWAAVQALLEEVAEESGHPELTTAPVFVTGGSRTGRWGTTIANLIPDRMLGYVTLVASAAPESNRTPKLYETPGLLIPGEHDKGSKIVAGAEELRAEGAKVGAAMMWGKGHTCGPCEHVLYPFVDSVVAHRLDDSGNVVPAPDTGIWLGEHKNWTASSQEEFSGDVDASSWLIDPHFAGTWLAFTRKEPKGEFTDPELLRKAPRVSETSAAELTSVSARLDGVSGEVQLYDGAAQLATATVEDGKVSFENIQVGPGIHSFYVAKDGAPVMRPVVAALLE